jgi:hypothetical protein
MIKRRPLFIGIGILIVALVSVTAYFASRSATAPSSQQARYSISAAKAMSMPITEKCLAKNDALTISASDRQIVERVAMSHLFDIPAGTNVDVLLATYSQQQVTGSDRYPAKYGNYNFTLAKQANGDWQFTKFEHCR